MCPMSEFELIANDIKTGIEMADLRIADFGYDHDRRYAKSCIQASVVSWMTAYEEHRLGGSFPSVVIDKLPDTDDPNWGSYIMPPPNVTLKNRMEAMWAIRIAYTHSAGYISGISNNTNQTRATQVPHHMQGCRIDGDLLDCSGLSLHTCIRSIVHVQDLLP